MNAQEQDLDRALAQLRTRLDAQHDDHGAGEPAFAVAAARARLQQQIGEPLPTAVDEPVRPAGGRRRRRWPAITIAASVAASVVAGAMLIGVPGTGPQVAEAAVVLEAAARQTIGTVDPPMRPDQYRLVDTRSWDLHTVVLDDRDLAGLVERRQSQWVPADPAEEWLLTGGPTGERRWIVGRAEEAAAAGASWPSEPGFRLTARCGNYIGSPEQDHCSGTGGIEAPTPEFLAGLPRDPAALLVRLGREAPGTDRDDAVLLGAARGLLQSPLRVPADLRSALYLALAQLHTLTVTPGQVNLDGRTGTALGVEDQSTRFEIIIDPLTGEYIGERRLALVDTDGVPAGSVIGYSSVSTAVVDHIGDVPPG